MTERERFERWAKRRGFDLERSYTGDYKWTQERYAWLGWQVRARVRVKPK